MLNKIKKNNKKKQMILKFKHISLTFQSNVLKLWQEIIRIYKVTQSFKFYVIKYIKNYVIE